MLFASQRDRRIGWAAALIVTVVLSLFAAQADRFPGDHLLTDWIQAVDFRGLDTASTAIYALGLWPAYLVAGVVVGAVCWHRRQRLATAFVALALVAHGVTVLLKELIERPRPPDDLVRVIGDPSGFSFPSGHVLGAVLLWGFVVYIAPAVISSRRRRWVVQGVALTVIALMGLQRVSAGAHWPSDVLGGYLWGALVLALIIGAFDAAQRRSTRRALHTRTAP